MNTVRPVAITGIGWEIPLFAGRRDLNEAFQLGSVAEPLFDPAQKLGKKGLRYKEKATVLALCAAKSALLHAGLIDADSVAVHDPSFGVAVASNTGNLDTVCRAADIIAREHVDATSSMDLPNASSNVVASSIAIRFGLGALNLMLCSGASASHDALVLAANAIRNGRARRMLVASVETDGLALRSLLAGRRDDAPQGEAPILEGACAVILESTEAAGERHARILAMLGASACAHARDPAQLAAMDTLRLGATPRPSELGVWIERSYGSAALLQVVRHCEQARHQDSDLAAAVMSGGVWNDRRVNALMLLPALRRVAEALPC